MSTKIAFLCCIFCAFFSFLLAQNGVNEIKVKDGSIKYVDFERIALTIQGDAWMSPSQSHKITYTFKAEELTTNHQLTWDTRLSYKEIHLPKGNWRITRDINVCTWDGRYCEVVERVKSNALGFVWN